jgi:hypothetical protein
MNKHRRPVPGRLRGNASVRLNKEGYAMKILMPCSILCLWALFIASGRQTASKVEPPRTVDKSFHFKIGNPAYTNGEGPVVLIDEAHNNFHTAVETYYPFAELLQRDGYVVKRGKAKISSAPLKSCRIYAISDAQPPAGKGDPPTFSKDEIDILVWWVKKGGALFLITDHMPDPGAIAGLAHAFGIEVNNGYVLSGQPGAREKPIVFSGSGKDRLEENAIMKGRNPDEAVKQVATFAGSAFRAGKRFQPLLVFGPGRRSWMPEEYWKFPPGTPNVSVEGWYQGGVMDWGEGKIAFFSEAAMFTAQIFDQGRTKVGMNHPLAKDNARLLLNVMHWLSDS